MTHLLLYVVERVGRVDGKADQDNVGVGVGERAETVVILLAGGIPEGELDVLAIDLDIGDIVLEDGGDVDLHGSVLVGALWSRMAEMGALWMRTSY